MKYQLNHMISIIGEKKIQMGSKGSRQWAELKRFDGKTVGEFEQDAKKQTSLKSSETFQKGKWWERELDNCLEKKVIRISSPTDKSLSNTKGLFEQVKGNDNKKFTGSSKDHAFVINEMNEIDMEKTGIYMAYPTTSVLKPIYSGYKAKVNDKHTKVGITKDSFFARKKSYLKTFDGEVKFIPVAVIPLEKLKHIEDQVVNRLSRHYSKVGQTKEWFETDERDKVLAIINDVL